MELKDVKIGQKLRVTKAVNQQDIEVGDIVTVSDISHKYVYVEGLMLASRMGLNASSFELAGLDLSLPAYTAEGTPVQIVTTQGRDPKYPVLAYEGNAKTLSKYTLTGIHKSGVARRSLTNVQNTETVEREFFVNLYDRDEQFEQPALANVGNTLYFSPDEATEAYNKGRHADKRMPERMPERIGVAKVVLVEGRLPKRVLKAIDKKEKNK